jgi:hypothetical protein
LLAGPTACSGLLGIQDRFQDSETDGGGGGSEGGGGPEAASQDSSGGQDSGTADASGPDGPIPSTDAPAESAACAAPCKLAENLDQPLYMASDATNVYWTEFGDSVGAIDGFVKSCPLAGCGSAPMVYAMAQQNPRGIASDGTNVYWGVDAQATGTGGIWSCPIAGCPPGQGPRRVVSADNPGGIAVDTLAAGYVYWVARSDGLVRRALKMGGTGAVVVWDGTGGVVNNLFTCAVDDTSVYFIDDWTDVLSVPLAGGHATTINNGSAQSPVALGNWGLALDATSVYFGTTGGIVRAAKTSTTGGSQISSSQQQPWGVAIDSATGELYYTDFGSGSEVDGVVGKLAPDGGGGVPLASALVEPFAITVSGPYVFWSSAGMGDKNGNTIPRSGAIYRMAK